MIIITHLESRLAYFHHMKDFFLGIKDCLRAHKVAVNNGMAWVYFIPVFFSIILITVIFIFIGDLVSAIAAPLIDIFQLSTPGNIPEDIMEKVWHFLKVAGEYTVYGILYVVSIYILFKIQKYIVLIAMAPLMAYVSEKAEEKLLGNTYDFNWITFLSDIWRGVRVALKNLFLELILVALIGLVISGLSVFFTPLAIIAVPLSAVLMFIVSAYYFGYSSFDYLNERRRMSVREGNRLIWDNKNLVAGNGAFFSLLMLVPVLGIIFAPVLCPVGAVISSQKKTLHPKKAD